MKKFGYILIGFFIISMLLGVRCVSNYFKSGFQIERKKVMYYTYGFTTWAREGEEVKGADIATFEVLDKEEGRHFAKDKNYFYHKGEPKENFDHQSGEYLGKSYYKDKNSVYRYSSNLKNSDPATFEIMEHLYSKDKNSVYHDRWKLAECDPATFQILEKRYSRDKKNLYFSRYLIEEADPNGFKLLLEEGRSPYYTDGKQVFFQKDVLKKSDPDSWGRLYGRYSKDKNQVYYIEKVVEGADATTFEAHAYKKTNGKQYNGQDKNHRYINGKRLP